MNWGGKAGVGWLVSALCAFLMVSWARGQTAIHSSSYFYSSPGTVTVTNMFSFPTTATLSQFIWYPLVPAGFVVSNVQGNGEPFQDGYGFIGFTGNPLPNPIVFTYDVTIPAGVTGDQPVEGYVWYDITPGLLMDTKASPDPLILRQPRSISGYIFHEEDNNGIYDSWDQPVPDINVLLLESGTTNRLAEPSVTDVNGYYSFGYLPDGDYDVAFMVKTNQVTIVPDGNDTNRNQLLPNSDKIVSVSIASATNVHINVGMTGEEPLASEIQIQAYRCAEGVFVEFMTVNEVGGSDSQLMVFRWMGSYEDSIYLGSAMPQGEGSFEYRMQVAEGLLDMDGPNDFLVLDEVGNEHKVFGIHVSDFKAELTRMTKDGLTLSWNSVPDKYYDVYETTNLTGTWTRVAWEYATGASCQTIVQIDPGKPTCFYKIVMRR